MLQFHWERIGKEDYILKFQRKSPELRKVRFPCQKNSRVSRAPHHTSGINLGDFAPCKTYRKDKAFCLLDQLFLGIEHTSSLLQRKSREPHKAQLTFVKIPFLRDYEIALVKSVFIRTTSVSILEKVKSAK